MDNDIWIRIKVQDKKSFEQILNRPLGEIFDSLDKNTNQCLLAYNNGINTFIKKTKTGYSINSYDTGRRDITW